MFKCNLSLGDIVVLTAAVRDLHAQYPGFFTTDVRTSFREPLGPQPLADEVG